MIDYARRADPRRLVIIKVQKRSIFYLLFLLTCHVAATRHGSIDLSFRSVRVTLGKKTLLTEASGAFYHGKVSIYKATSIFYFFLIYFIHVS